MVKRYDCTDVHIGYDNYAEMQENIEGDWVTYNDYERLHKENDQLKIIVTAARNIKHHWLRTMGSGTIIPADDVYRLQRAIQDYDELKES